MLAIKTDSVNCTMRTMTETWRKRLKAAVAETENWLCSCPQVMTNIIHRKSTYTGGKDWLDSKNPLKILKPMSYLSCYHLLTQKQERHKETGFCTKSNLPKQ